MSVWVDYILSIDGKTVDTVKGMREIIDAISPETRFPVQYEHNGRSRNNGNSFSHRYLKVISNEILDPGYWKDKREMDAGGSEEYY